MTIYESAYRALQGTGISRNPMMEKINRMVMAKQIMNPILMKDNFYLFLDQRPPLNTAAYYLANREYEMDESREIRKRIKGGVAIDAGASIGYFSLLLAQRCSKVYAFEPSAETFKLLEGNIAYNWTGNRIEAHRLALSNRAGAARLYHDRKGAGNNSLTPNQSGEGERVELKTLDSIIPGKERIAFLKMDIEGHEEEALEGARRTLKRTDALMLEYNRNQLRQRGKDGRELFTLLKGFRMARITAAGLKPVKGPEDLEGVKDFCNLWGARA